MIDGYYYLHENKSLIYKRELGDTAADIRESPFAIAMWSLDPTDRECCWSILIEALALGANRNRILDLSSKWSCDNNDAVVYANRVGAVLTKDGDQFCATRKDFVNLQESPAGFGDTALEALAGLCHELGFIGGKMWNKTFKDLLQ